MTDPIKAALIVAAQELAVKQRDDMEYREAAAMTIAAFLRALQDGNYPYPSPPWATGWSGIGRAEGRVHGVHPHRLAAAVEEAARHD
jgi:hypothetical protein